jgi:hypothetical protein
MIVLVLTRREGVALTWQQVALPVTMGLALAFLEIGGMDTVRTIITRAFGLPF